MFANKYSLRPDWLSILSNQAFHLYFCFPIMDTQKIPIVLKAFRKIHLVSAYCFLPVNGYPGDNSCRKIMQNSMHPYFLYNILVFFEQNDFRHKGYFRCLNAVSSFRPRWYISLKSSKSNSVSDRFAITFPKHPGVISRRITRREISYLVWISSR